MCNYLHTVGNNGCERSANSLRNNGIEFLITGPALAIDSMKIRAF